MGAMAYFASAVLEEEGISEEGLSGAEAELWTAWAQAWKKLIMLLENLSVVIVGSSTVGCGDWGGEGGFWGWGVEDFGGRDGDLDLRERDLVYGNRD